MKSMISKFIVGVSAFGALSAVSMAQTYIPYSSDTPVSLSVSPSSTINITRGSSSSPWTITVVDQDYFYYTSGGTNHYLYDYNTNGFLQVGPCPSNITLTGFGTSGDRFSASGSGAFSVASGYSGSFAVLVPIEFEDDPSNPLSPTKDSTVYDAFSLYVF